MTYKTHYTICLIYLFIYMFFKVEFVVHKLQCLFPSLYISIWCYIMCIRIEVYFFCLLIAHYICQGGILGASCWITFVIPEYPVVGFPYLLSCIRLKTLCRLQTYNNWIVCFLANHLYISRIELGLERFLAECHWSQGPTPSSYL